jgi:hypothetical protein
MDTKENLLIVISYKEYLMSQKVCADVRREAISVEIKFTDASYSQKLSSISAILIWNSK